jgi:membrane fusion protein, multidrug efflux system
MKLRLHSSSLLVLSLFVALLSGCAGGGEKKASAQGPPPSVPVVVATVTKKNIPISIRAIGNVQPFQTVSIKSQISAELTEVHFKEGQDVNKGQLLFELDPRPLEADLERNRGNLLRDEAQAKNAQAQASRYAALMKEGVVAREQYDQFISNAEALEAAVAADKAAVKIAQVQLQYTKIYSPVSGRTGNLMVNRGNLVKANDVPILVTINQVTPIFVEFSIPENQLADVKRYLAAKTLRVQAIPSAAGQGSGGSNQASSNPTFALPNPGTASSTAPPPLPGSLRPGPGLEPVDGQLTFVDNAVDPATGTIKLKGTFANKDRRLWPGQFVDVVLTLTTQPDAVTIPTQAVQTSQAGQYVFVVKQDNTAEMRAVTVSSTFGGESVVATGLQPGERVVIEGALRLTKGTKVEVKTSAAQFLTQPVEPRT